MKCSAIFSASLAAFASLAAAHPGTGRQLEQIKARMTGEKSTALLGDLVTRGAETETGATIQDILTGKANPQSSETYSGDMPAKDSEACKQDTCCIWKYIADEMGNVFRGPGGRCTAFARHAIRLAFHDSGAWEEGRVGGADGSVVLSGMDGELSRTENSGLDAIARLMQGWYDRYHQYGIGMADLIQMASAAATVSCPLGPRSRSFVGRRDRSEQNDAGLIPGPFDSADSMTENFQRKTIGIDGLVALIGAHTTSQQRFVNQSRALDPQDSTPGVWDTLYYSQTLGTVPKPKRVLTFQSDQNLADDSRTGTLMQKYAGSQATWNNDYAREFVRLSLLGVDNINDLTECTKALPPVNGRFESKDGEAVIEEWLNGEHDEVSPMVSEGEVVSA